MYEFIILQLVVLSIASHDMAFPFQVVNFTFSLGAYVVRAAGAGEGFPLTPCSTEIVVD